MKMFILIIVFSLTGCAGTYPNWEHVRIEKSVPNNTCEYKMQEACSAAGSKCYIWYKKRATIYEANTVVITESKAGIAGKSRSFLTTALETVRGHSNSQINSTTTALADYYYCEDKKSFIVGEN